MDSFILGNVLTAITGDKQQNKKSTISVAAKSVLYHIKESPRAYPPLKSIAGYLWYILDSSDVRPSSPTFKLKDLPLL